MDISSNFDGLNNEYEFGNIIHDGEITFPNLEVFANE